MDEKEDNLKITAAANLPWFKLSDTYSDKGIASSDFTTSANSEKTIWEVRGGDTSLHAEYVSCLSSN